MPLAQTAIEMPSAFLVYLDQRGIIVDTNRPKKEASRKSNPVWPELPIGQNYLVHCANEAHKRDVRALLKGELDIVASVYARDLSSKKHWFVAVGFPAAHGNIRAALAHINVTLWVPQSEGPKVGASRRSRTNDGPNLMSTIGPLQQSIAQALVQHFGEPTHAIPGAVTGTAQQKISALSPRQREVLMLIAAGKSNIQIADHISCSLNTVKRHVTAVLQKLGLSSRTQAALMVAKSGSEDDPPTF
jgi:DNA-binding CsgD family transcriptional regulator